MRMFGKLGLAVCAATLSMQAASFAISTGSWYTTNLRNDLLADGQSVTEISSYTAATLASFNVVIQYGNQSFYDTAALEAYVNAGGTLVLTPWFWGNGHSSPNLNLITGTYNPQYTIPNPGMTVLAPGDSLLTGVTFPGAGSPNIGREGGRTWGAGVTEVVNWADGVPMLGYVNMGAGRVIALNMHLITSDTAYQVIDQPWAQQILLNAAGATTVPEPSALGLAALGVGLVALRLWKRG